MRTYCFCGLIAIGLLADFPGMASGAERLEVGIAVRDVTPDLPIWLSGYAARRRAADRVDHRLKAQAVALRNDDGSQFVLVALDNCEVSHAFNEPLLTAASARFSLKPGELMIVSSHTHSAPVLEHTLTGMFQLSGDDQEAIARYSRRLREQLLEVIGAALSNSAPSHLVMAKAGRDLP